MTHARYGSIDASSGQSHPSLPPRPPPSSLNSGFKNTFSTAPGTKPSYSANTAAAGYSTFPSSYPGASHYGAVAPGAQAGSAAPASFAARRGRGGMTHQSYQPHYNYAQNSHQAGYYGGAGVTSGLQIRNPFPTTSGDDYESEMQAQIEQWQSAYMPKEAGNPTTTNVGKNGRFGNATMTTNSISAASPYPSVAPATADAPDGVGVGTADNEKKKTTVYRSGGGKKWADDTLLEWDPAHLRLFVGNLAGETTDDSLLKAFSRWKSVQKARVIRDKRTSKSKGFGFVSFSDPDDFFQAAKEMNGKYIQSHPVVVRKSTAEIKPQVVKEERHGKGSKNKGGDRDGGRGGSNHHRSGNGVSGGAKQHDAGRGYDSHLGPMGGGVTKPGQKTKGGLKLLG